jgi:hypothetical protein
MISDLQRDLQRWFVRQSAKNMRREIGGQVRQTLGGRKDSADVWDVATTEIPPEVGESPECQWCPICRAARRMRESGPGLGGQMQGAGEAVATAVQDAMGALDGLLNRAGGGNQPRAAGWTGPPPPGWTRKDEPGRADQGSTQSGAAQNSAPQESAPSESAPQESALQESAPQDSASGGAGQANAGNGPSWARGATADAWQRATSAQPDDTDSETDAGTAAGGGDEAGSAQPDGQ